MKRLLRITLVMFVLSIGQISAQSSKEVQQKGREGMSLANEFFAKGGLGLIRDQVFVKVKSAKNEVLLPGGLSWHGKDASDTQVVLVIDGIVHSGEDLPRNFDLRKAIVISFESERIYFFDFTEMAGGFYKRRISR